ncbi:MAG: hypothetical protein ACK4N5_26390, partial [Myxococcales bacterium]
MIARLAQRLASFLLVTYGRLLWGVYPAIMPAVVERLGPLKALWWMTAQLPRYTLTFRRLGPMRANLLYALASLLNGCSYCVYAHGRAFQLHYFREKGSVFPIDEHGLVALGSATDAELVAELESAFRRAGLPEELARFRRLYALKLEGAVPSGREDAMLTHAIAMYDVLNYCAIAGQTPLDDAHDPINRDRPLKERY